MQLPDDAFDLPEAKIVRETDKAVLVESPELPDSPLWMPKAVIHDDSEVFQHGDEGTLLVKMRFAEERGWL